jgi:hypothetical protein
MVSLKSDTISFSFNRTIVAQSAPVRKLEVGALGMWITATPAEMFADYSVTAATSCLGLHGIT